MSEHASRVQAVQTETEQQARARRALVHFNFCLAFLSVGDANGANDYLRSVVLRDGRTMQQSVCDMIAVHCHIAPLEL